MVTVSADDAEVPVFSPAPEGKAVAKVQKGRTSNWVTPLSKTAPRLSAKVMVEASLERISEMRPVFAPEVTQT